MFRDVHFNESGPLWIPDDTALQFNCGGRRISTWHELGGLRLGERSTLIFTDCAVSTFCDWEKLDGIDTNDSVLEPRLFGNTPLSTVEAVDSSVEYPCEVRSDLYSHSAPELSEISRRLADSCTHVRAQILQFAISAVVHCALHTATCPCADHELRHTRAESSAFPQAAWRIKICRHVRDGTFVH